MHRVPRAVRRAAAPPRRVSVKGAGRERALSVVGAPRVLGVVIHPGGRLGRVDQNGLASIWLVLAQKGDPAAGLREDIIS
jgi:hypothetical protein